MDEIPDIRDQLCQLAQLLMESSLPPVASVQPASIAATGKLEKCKNESGDEWSNLEAQAAFLGPNIWEKSNEFGNDLQLGDQYVDLDEFLNASVLEDNGSQRRTASPPQIEAAESNAASMVTDVTETTERVEEEEEEDEEEAAMDEDDLSEPPSPAESSSSNDSDDSYHPPPAKRTRGRGRGGGGGVSSDNPRSRKLPADDLKPQPIVKKSRKQFVPDDLKDERYWARRRKNNLAAKRSRDARRDKENQIVVRAAFLEKENETLKQENERLKNENKKLKGELAKCKK